MITTLIAATLVLAQGQDAADRMLRAATADQPLVHSAIVNAPVKEVWKAWTTAEGIKSWMLPNVSIELRVGGKMRSSYAPGSDLNGPQAIENTILAFDPERMLSMRCTRTPEGFPFKKAMDDAWTVLYLEPAGEGKTKVVIRMLGYTHDPESMEMKKFFDKGNQITLDALVKHFEK